MDVFDIILILLPGLVVYLSIHESNNQNKTIPEYGILVLGILLGFPVLFIFWGVESWIFDNKLASITCILASLKTSGSIITYLIITLISAPLIAFLYNKTTVILIPNIQDKIHKRPFESIENSVWQKITRQYFLKDNTRLIIRLSSNGNFITCGELISLSSHCYINNKEIFVMHESIIKLYLNIYDELQEALDNKSKERIETLTKKNALEDIATYYDFNSGIKIELFNGNNLPN